MAQTREQNHDFIVLTLFVYPVFSKICIPGADTEF